MKMTLLLLGLVAARLALADQAAAPGSPAPSTPPPAVPAPSAQGMADLRTACELDVKTLCAGVQPGGGRILACLKQHRDEVSQGCKQAVQKARQSAS